MLSYRHSFHAGNHADVLKHCTLIFCIRHFLKKEKPFLYVDTHGGAGLYDLESEASHKTGEYKEGILKLIDSGVHHPITDEYFDTIASFNPGERIELYPGSPAIAQKLLRDNDQLRVHELHSTDFELLNTHLGTDKRITLIQKDGLRGMIKAMPPMSKRALVLIDPSYEIKADYEVIPFAIDDALFRFPSATILIWYPMLPEHWERRLTEALKTLPPKSHCQIEWQVQRPERGMYGSGVWIINPPWNLPASFEGLDEILCKNIGDPDHSNLKIKNSIQ